MQPARRAARPCWPQGSTGPQRCPAGLTCLDRARCAPAMGPSSINAIAGSRTRSGNMLYECTYTTGTYSHVNAHHPGPTSLQHGQGNCQAHSVSQKRKQVRQAGMPRACQSNHIQSSPILANTPMFMPYTFHCLFVRAKAVRAATRRHRRCMILNACAAAVPPAGVHNAQTHDTRQTHKKPHAPTAPAIRHR